MSNDHVSQLTRSERVKLALKTRGLMARVARRCKVTHGMVSRVLRGINVSARVSRELDKQLNEELLKAALLREHAANTKAQQEARVA